MAQLTQWLALEKESAQTPLVKMRSGKVETPLYCFHTGWGHIRGYYPLVDALDIPLSVYGLQLRALPDLRSLPKSMDVVTTDYTDIIQKHSPGGPYYLLGWSLGGLIAFCVAAKLEELGEEVAFLGLLDPSVPAALPVPPMKGWVEQFAAYLENPSEQARLHNLHASEQQDITDAVRGLSTKEAMAFIAHWGREKGYWLTDVPKEAIELQKLLAAHSDALIHSFTATRIRAPIHVWWARDTLDACGFPPVEWASYTCGCASIEIVDTDHDNIIQHPRMPIAVKYAIESVSPWGQRESE